MKTWHWIIIGAVVLIIIYIIFVSFKARDPFTVIIDDEWRKSRGDDISNERGTAIEVIKVDYIESADSGESDNYYHFQVLETQKNGHSNVVNLKGYPPNSYLLWSSWTYTKG